jgi:hypothetical protein
MKANREPPTGTTPDALHEAKIAGSNVVRDTLSVAAMWTSFKREVVNVASSLGGAVGGCDYSATRLAVCLSGSGAALTVD